MEVRVQLPLSSFLSQKGERHRVFQFLFYCPCLGTKREQQLSNRRLGTGLWKAFASRGFVFLAMSGVGL